MTHKVFVFLSILWALALPIHVLRAMIIYGDAGSGAARLGYALGTMVLFFPWIVVLIPLVIAAVYTKPKQG